MKILLLIITSFLSSLSFAEFEKLTVKNLDLKYEAPYGKGTVEKVGIGLGLVTTPYEIELFRTEDSFELTSPYVNFSWINPMTSFYEIEKLTAMKTTASIGTKRTHFVVSELFMFKPKDRGEYKAENLSLRCEGLARGEFHERLLDDCRTKLDLSIRRIDVPTDFIVYKLLEDLPKILIPETEIPADHVVGTINNGDLYLQIYIKYIVYAGLRTWGHVQYEDDRKTIAIRVDQIKFGYIPVTQFVMKRLKEIITNPDVRVDPPWIRIDVSDLK